jgi:hypothetical protein
MTSDGGGWTLVVGINASNQDHVNITSITPSNLSLTTGKWKISDIDINILKTEYYKLECNVWKIFLNMDNSFVSTAYTNSNSNITYSTDQSNWISAIGSSSPHYGIWNYWWSVNHADYLIYKYSGNGCFLRTVSGLGDGNLDGKLWVR